MEQADKNTRNLFSPALTNWLIGVVVGVIVPLFAQDIIASQISNLSTLPTNTGTKINAVDPVTIFIAACVLFVVFVGYVATLAYQIRYISSLKTHSSVWAFVITCVGPIFVWFVLPYALIAFSS